MMRRAAGLLGLALVVAAGTRAAGPHSIEELLATPVTGVSGREERLADAPAMVLVFDATELAQRGYRALIDLLADLPAVDLARPAGATWFKAYVRGQRTTIGDTYLVTRDGAVLNHLYYDNADLLAALPLSDLERVEVIYGPASAVYGANAFSGVINLVTRRRATPGGEGHATLTAGEGNFRAADGWVAWNPGGWRFSLALRNEQGESDREAANRYEYTNDRYLADPRLWGGFAADRRYGGAQASPHRFNTLEVRGGRGAVEFGALKMLYSSGYGSEYAYDRSLNRGEWIREQTAVHLRCALAHGRFRHELIARWREDGVRSDSRFIERVDDPLTGTPAVSVSLWRSVNRAWSADYALDAALAPAWQLNAGLRVERRDLQKAYEIAQGAAIPAASADPATYPFPPRGGGSIPDNRIRFNRAGGFALAVWHPTAKRQLNLGARLDHDARYGTATTLRAGWVERIGRWSWKFLYGEAYQEPNPRILYGGWTGSGADPDLDPELSRTLESGVAWAGARVLVQGALYDIRTRKALVNTATGAENIGRRRVTGADLWLEGRLPLGEGSKLSWWGGAGRYFTAQESVVASGGARERRAIGDLSRLRLRAGVSWNHGPWRATFAGRHAGRRETVATNPERVIDAATVADLTLGWHPDSRWGVDVRAANVFDATYDEPGVRDADAGSAPGGLDGAGAWRGSAGYFSSRLPQAGRSVSVALRAGW